MNKSKLNDEELKEFFEKTKHIDKKVDHGRAYRTLMNPMRRDILQFIGYEIKTVDELKKEFGLDESQLDYHLTMLKQAFYVLNSNEGYKLTPRGIGFIENAQLSD